MECNIGKLKMKTYIRYNGELYRAVDFEYTPALKQQAHSNLKKAAEEAVKAYRASSTAEDYVEQLLR